MSRTSPANGLVQMEQLRLLHAGLPPSVAATIVLSGLCAFVLWPAVPHDRLLIWLTVQVAMSLTRLWQWRSYRRSPRTSPGRWLRKFRISTIGSGALWGLLAIICYPADLPHEAFVAFVLAGVSSAATTSLAADRYTALAFLICSTTPLAVQLMRTPSSISAVMGLMVILFLAFTSLSARRANLQFMDNLSLRTQADAAQSELARALAEVSLARAQLEAFIAHAPAAVAMFDTQLRYLAHSYRWLTDYGLEGQLLIGRSHYEVFPEIGADWKEIHQRCLKGAVERREEDRFVRADGSVQWVHWEVRPWRNAQGVIGGIVMLTENITLRRAVEAERRRLAERVSLATESAGIGIWEWDAVADALTWDERMYAQYGLPYQQPAIDRARWRQLLHPTDLPRAEAAYRRALDAHQNFDAEYRILRPDATERTLKVIARVQRDSVGTPLRMIGVSWDITELKRVERLKSEFVSVVSHELRTPLTSLRGSIGLIAGGAAGPLSDEVRGLIQIASRNSDRLAALIDDLLDLDKMDAGKMRLHIERTDLLGVVRYSIEATVDFARPYGVTLRLLDQSVTGWVDVDPHRLQQVMANLLSNAAKFTHPGTCVDIVTLRKDKCLRVEVRDRGPGVPAEFRDRLFQKFSQADSSDTRIKGGTGLGLAVSKAIIEAFGGAIGCDSKPGEGATFYFELPSSEA